MPRPNSGRAGPDHALRQHHSAVEQQPPYPGDREIERRIKSIIRWNAMAMVVKANSTTNVGGHIATFASSATLYEVAFNHFFRGRTENFPGDQVYFQGTPRRACMRGRFWKAG
jgi:pyruvate dehydrogenase complex dehydrogenase (E1) component